jgi:alanine racemase
MYRKTFIEINLDNIIKNVKTIIKKYPNYKYYIGMVKSNAYGHGMYVINEMINNGINYLAVSNLEEALDIRRFNKNIPILCVEPIELDFIDVASKNNITITIHDIDYFKKLNSQIKNKVKVHIKIDTGMNRLGIKDKDEFNEIIKLIKENDNIYLEGLFTHFATPGVNDKFYDNQISKFKYITSDIDLSKIDIVHLSSSFIMLAHPKIEFANGVRCGTILFGYDIAPKKLNNSPKNLLRRIRNSYLIKRYNISKTYENVNIDLKPAFKVKTNVIQIKKVKKHEKVGYGILYEAKKDELIATLPIGYDDGIGINHENRYVLINDKKYKVVGEISMCMMNVLVDESVKVGDSVIIMGDSITLGMISRINNTSIHNTLVNIGKVLPRVYKKDNKIVYIEKFIKEGK